MARGIALCGMLVAALLSHPKPASSQTTTVWTTHTELLEWIPVDQGAEGRVEERREDGRAFLRLRPPWFWMTLSREAHELLVPGDIAPIVDLERYNALRIAVRSTLTTSTISGFWTHVNTQYDESLRGIPHFLAHTLPGDDSWREIVLRFSESPFVEWDRGVARLFLGPKLSWRTPKEEFETFAAALQAQDEGAYLDVDRIELVRVDESLQVPVVTGFSPARGEMGTLVEIAGEGFVEPPGRNLVWLGDGESESEAEVTGGDTETLMVVVPSGPGARIRVRTSGGEATSDGEFHKLLPPSQLRIVEGDGQVAPVGSRLDPLVVELVDRHGEGLPGHNVTFEVIAGGGSLSAAESVTDEAGRASVLITLGPLPRGDASPRSGAGGPGGARDSDGRGVMGGGPDGRRPWERGSVRFWLAT